MHNNTTKMLLAKLHRMDVSDQYITNYLNARGYPITRSALWRQRKGEVYKSYSLFADTQLVALLKSKKDFIEMIEGLTK